MSAPDRFKGRDAGQRKHDRPRKPESCIDPFASESPRERELERGENADGRNRARDRMKEQQGDREKVIPSGPKVPAIADEGSACRPLLACGDVITTVEVAREVRLDGRQQVGRNI